VDRGGAANRVGILLLTLLAATAGGLLVRERPAGHDSASADALPVTFHCQLDASCPEVIVAGDPFATLGTGPAPFRGYGDPSLELDPSTGTLWLSYSWLDVLVSDPGPPPVIDFGVRTHLARSDDGGASFTFVRSVNETVPLAHPDTAVQGWTTHEVSTLVREGPGAWQMMWFTYFDPFGEPPGPEDRSDYYYTRSNASSAAALGDASQPWIRGWGTSPSFGAQYDLSTIPQLADCFAFTEPALFSQGGAIYLATSCVVIAGGVRRDDLERLVLLRQEAGGYSYVGTLLDSADALDLGATRIEQADLAVSRSGAVLLIATPIVSGGTPEHLGCVVFHVSDLGTAQVERDAAGNAVQLARITGDDGSVGPGLCTYDAASQTGLLMVLHVLNPDPYEMVFSLRATGIHPDVPGDADGDGVSNAIETACGSDPLDAGKRPERVDSSFAGVSDDGDPEIDEALPPGSGGYDCDGDGYTGNDELTIFSAADTRDDQAPCPETPIAEDEPNDRWPPDFDDNQIVNISDVFQVLPPYFGTVAPPTSPRRDLAPDAVINVSDVFKVLPPFFGLGCT